MKYKKKPIIVEAFVYHKKDTDIPDWAYDAFVDKTLYYDSLTGYGPATELFVKTLEGPMHVSEGDYIIKGVRGELYPCNPNSFLMSYDEYTD